jgi:hypothetical protein
MAIEVDVVAEGRYWYPDEGGQVWLDGLTLVDGDGRYLGRDDPLVVGRGLHVVAVAGAARHHGDALATAHIEPGDPLDLQRDRENAHDPNAIRVLARGQADQLGWVPRDLAAAVAPDLDAGQLWTALALRERRASPRDPRTGLTMLLSAEPVELRVRA